jgi:hypothetical protein
LREWVKGDSEMASVKFLENLLRPWTPLLADEVEDEIRRAAAPDCGLAELGCRICLDGTTNDLRVGIFLEREGWGARFEVPFPSARGEVRLTTERVLRERAVP